MSEAESSNIEIWKPVVGWEGFYEVSNCGRIRNVAIRPRTKPGKILRPVRVKNGYHSVSLCRPGKIKSKSIHGMVLEAFVGNFPHGMEANHKNGDNTDNRLTNLEYVDHATNVAHAINVLGRKPCGETNGRHKLTEASVHWIRKQRSIGRSYAHIGKEIGVNETTVRHAALGISWSHIQ